MPKRYLRGPVTWKVTWKDIANWRIQRLNDYTKSQRHVWMTTNLKEEEIGSLGELSTVCSQIVVKCLYLARIGSPDILWSVNKLARAVTKLTKPCDKRLGRLVSYILHQTKKQNHREKVTGKLFGKNTIKHAETESNLAHQSRSDQY